MHRASQPTDFKPYALSLCAEKENILPNMILNIEDYSD